MVTRFPRTAGFSLIEILIAISIFLIIGTGVYLSYANILDVIARTRTHTLATSLINKQIEAIRNLPFDSVGIVGGAPAGVIPASTTVVYEGQQFVIGAYVHNIDDVFDGKLGATPNDTAPADYRLVELQISCPTCFNFVPVVFTTWVSPQNLESSTKNGSLFVNVFDANGQAIGNANVLVKNTVLSPDITINDTTNNSGTLQLVDIPTSTSAYEVTVSKSGYTTRQTYIPGGSSNPNPVQPHATVASQQITAISFAIDRASTVNVKTQDQYCADVPSIDMTQNGQKMIGTGPDVLLYSQSFVTNSSGDSTRGGLEWDTYSFTNTDVGYDSAGSIPLAPLVVNPNTTINLNYLMEPKSSSSLLTTITTVAGAPVASATVTLTKTGFDQSKLTGLKAYEQTNWAGGQYAGQDGNLADSSPAGEVALIATAGEYPTSTNSYLESSTIDFGTATTTFADLVWTPTSQPAATTLKLQLASSNSSAGPWSYIGPDGTGGTYFTATSTLSGAHNNKQYLRYKAYFDTTDKMVTPKLQDVGIGFYSSCVPSGQAFWPGLGTGTYTVTASKSGYQNATTSVTVGSGWQEVKLILQ